MIQYNLQADESCNDPYLACQESYRLLLLLGGIEIAKCFVSNIKPKKTANFRWRKYAFTIVDNEA